MEKQEVIKKFKNGCYSLINLERRMMAIQTQFNRSCWQVTTKSGLIRIDCSSAPLYTMLIFHTLDSVKENNLKKGEQEFSLTWQEYDELRDAYFGNLKPDIVYLQSVGALG